MKECRRCGRPLTREPYATMGIGEVCAAKEQIEKGQQIRIKLSEEPMTHCLKTWPQFFRMQLDGNKPWELRKMDRPYKLGDTFISQEWDPEKSAYTGREKAFGITYILSGEEAQQFGLQPGYGILTLKEE